MPVMNAIFTTTIYKNKFDVFFFKCHVFVTKGFPTDIYTVSILSNFFRKKYEHIIAHVFILATRASKKNKIVF